MALVVGITLLLGGLAAGAVLVSQPQLLDQKASVAYSPIQYCDNQYSCSDINSPLTGFSETCLSRTTNKPLSCCQQNYHNVNGECVITELCRQDTAYNSGCSQDYARGSSICLVDYNEPLRPLYCCPEHFKTENGRCVPYNTLCAEIGIGLDCRVNFVLGSSACLQYATSTTSVFCCPENYVVENGMCAPK